jgi:hypothetical protein
MYIYTQTRATHDSPPPGAQLFTSVSVYTATRLQGKALKTYILQASCNAIILEKRGYILMTDRKE